MATVAGLSALRKQDPALARAWIRTGCLFAFFIGLTLLVRLPFFFWPLTDDEGSYAYTAHWWFRGYTLYSNELWFDRPQGIFLAYKAGMLLFGESTWAIRFWGALWAGVTVWIVYLIARRLFNFTT